MNILTFTKPMMLISKLFGLTFYTIQHRNQEIKYGVSKILVMYRFVALHLSLVLIKDVFPVLTPQISKSNLLLMGHVVAVLLVPAIFQLIGRSFLLLQSKSICRLIYSFEDIFIRLEKINMKPHLKLHYRLNIFALLISSAYALTLIGGGLSEYDTLKGMLLTRLNVLTEILLTLHFVHFLSLLNLLRIFFKSINEGLVKNVEQNLVTERIRELMEIDEKVKDAVEELNSIYSVTNWVTMLTVFIAFFLLVPLLPVLHKLRLEDIPVILPSFMKAFITLIRAAAITATSELVTSEVSTYLEK